MNMRFMYSSETPEFIPGDAALAAYYPHAIEDAPIFSAKTIQVHMDKTGEFPHDCHVLDLNHSDAAQVNGRAWVEKWYTHHPNGMPLGSGVILRPVIRVLGHLARSVHVLCAPYDIDTWAIQHGKDSLPIAGCFAREYEVVERDGRSCGISYVYRGQWGMADSTAMRKTQKPESRSDSLTGMLIQVVGGSLVETHVRSRDGGATWRP